jgi:hypothetical protein
MVDLAQARLQTERLIAWYWDYGRRRTQYHLPYSWLFELYQLRDTARALSISDTRDVARKSLAVWGPSQSGKSMLISRFLDARDGPQSALTWKQGDRFRFKPTSEFPDIMTFNPHKSGTDASGCVTRFRLAEKVADPEHPVEISFGDRRQIMQAITTGYLMECRRELPGVGIVDVDDEFIRRELTPDAKGVPEQEAVERLVDLVSVVDRLLPDEYERFRKLKYADKVWQKELRGALVADQNLASSVERATRTTSKVLWDDRPKLNELFQLLERYRSKIASIAGRKPIMCSLQFAAHVVDIDTYGVLAGDVKDVSAKVARLAAGLLNETTFMIEQDRVVIGTDARGQRLFENVTEFGLFQALVWELAVPLNAQFFRGSEKYADALAFLDRIEILDIPGVARAQQGPERTLFDLDAKNAAQSRLLSEVVKRGKTATIINRYAEQLRVDGLLLLNIAGDPPSQPKQLIAGVESIWDAAVPGYQAASGERPPIPLALCLTFMGQSINESVSVGIARMNLSGLERTLSKLGDLTKPGVGEIFVTTYPDVPGAEVSPEARSPAVREALLHQDWVQARFATPDERQSWRALLEDEDGGVGHLLQSLARMLADSSRDRRIRSRAEEIARAVTRLIQTGAPIRADDGHRHSRALNALADRVIATLESAPRTQDAALALSWQLRRLIAFDDADTPFDPMPQHASDDRGVLETYVKTQLERWAARPAARALLAELGVDDEDQIPLLNALRETIDVDTVVDWVMECIDSIDNSRAARHLRRYVAAKCAETLMANQQEAPEVADGAGLAETNFAKFTTWIERRRPQDSPHFDAVITPTVRRLKDIAKLHITNDWVAQPGDDDIEAMQQAWAKMTSARAAPEVGP